MTAVLMHTSATSRAFWFCTPTSCFLVGSHVCKRTFAKVMYLAVLKNKLSRLPTALGTRVAGALGCSRKAVLEERFGGSTTNEAALSGTLLHEMLQV